MGAMRDREASRTAEYMALFRALESTRPARRRLFVDPFAVEFLRPRLRRVVRLSRLPLLHALVARFIDRRYAGARTSGIARTRCIDDAVEAALATGIDQVVVLGAGFDARAYRLPSLARAVVFEVDHPSTSAVKRAVIRRVLGAPPAHVRFVPLDFNTQALSSTMAAAGYDGSRRTLVVWEGVTNYLTAEAVDSTLGWCASAPAGSRIVFTYVDRRILDTPQAFGATGQLFEVLAASSERWTFGLDPSGLAAFLAARGLVLDEDVGAAEYRARYFGGAAARMRGYEFYHTAVAHVP